MNRILLACLVLVSYCFPAKSQKAEILHLMVESGNYQRINTPVSFGLEGVLISDTLSFLLFEKINGKLIEKTFQIEPGYIPQLWWVLDGTTGLGKTREYFLYKNMRQNIENKITTVVTHDAIVLKNGNSEILHYQTAVLYPPAKVDTSYKRSGFIHPLMTPSGNILTRVSPPDHYHHVGIWNPWTRVKIGNHVTDFWNLYEKQGTVRFAGINSTVNGPVYGGFSVRQEHIDFQGKKPEELAINEVWDVRAWNVEPLTGLKAYLVDLTTFLSVAGDSTIVFEAYRYGGGIGIRANEEWTKDNSTVLTSEGKTRLDADGTRARWTDLNGAFKNNGNSGIVFFSHPSNREHPEPMRVWPITENRGRGDVYFEFCPIRHKEWVLNPGNVYRLKYRMLVYDGKIDKSIADRIWNDFAYPPIVRLLNK
ncbi:MAG: PmoA family protein [Bacteroidales bacterium]|nr:PmoA family protein [Bacteroidales bacterium]